MNGNDLKRCIKACCTCYNQFLEHWRESIEEWQAQLRRQPTYPAKLTWFIRRFGATLRYLALLAVMGVAFCCVEDSSARGNIAVFGVAALVALWYAEQTKRMARATELAAKAAIRPHLRITTEKQELPPNDDAKLPFVTKVTNVGLGPAFWVEKWLLYPSEKVPLRDFRLLADYLGVHESAEIARSARDPSDPASPPKQKYILEFRDLAQTRYHVEYSYFDDAWCPFQRLSPPPERDEPPCPAEASNVRD